MVREAKVRQLTAIALAALEAPARDCTAGEVLSAFMTMARNAAAAARETGADLRTIREALELILLECADGRKQ